MKTYTPEKVAEDLGVCKRTVYRWVKEGRISGVKIGRKIFIPADSFKETMKLS